MKILVLMACLVLSQTCRGDEVWLYVGDDINSEIVKLAVSEGQSGVDYVINVIDQGWRRERPALALSEHAKPVPINYWHRLCDCPVCFYKRRSDLFKHLEYSLWYRRQVLSGSAVAEQLEKRYDVGEYTLRLWISYPLRQPPRPSQIYPIVDFQLARSWGTGMGEWYVPITNPIGTASYWEISQRVATLSRSVENAAWLQDNSRIFQE